MSGGVCAGEEVCGDVDDEKRITEGLVLPTCFHDSMSTPGKA